jgi:hypothetical protein
MSVRIVTDFKVIDRLIKNAKGKHVRIIADGVKYGIFREFGTRRMAAHPFMIPALEAVRTAFLQAMRQVNNWEHGELVIEKLARDCESYAKQNAPVDTGALRSSIHIEKP